MLRFEGRVAIVTGAGRGLGREYAKLLAARGCAVVVNDAGVHSTGAPGELDPASIVAGDIKQAGGVALASRHDIVTEAAALVDAAVAAFGRLDIVINNAGILDGGLFGDTAQAVWDHVAAVHYKGTVAVCRAAWPHLRAAGAGRIVNTSSTAMFGGPQLTSYGSAKAAIFGFTRSLAIEGAADGLHVNAVMPSAWTRMTERIEDPNILRVLQEHLRPERVAPLVVWLAHSSTQLNGEIIRTSGGRAGRVVTATTASVAAAEDTPEAWLAQADALMEKSVLTELRSTLDAFAAELREAEADLDLDAAFKAGGVLHDEDHTPD